VRDGGGGEDGHGAQAPPGPSPAVARRLRRREPALDAASREWLVRLTAEGRGRDDAIAELLELLCDAARFVLVRRQAWASSLLRETVDDLAAEAAGEALIQILAHLDDYRGASRFTTWAWKFAFYEALQAVRRRSWTGRELPLESGAWQAIASDVSPEQRLEQRQLLEDLKTGVEALTPYQRTVFVALALDGVPVDVLAERFGTTRGALYKTLHVARQRLRRHLSA
jgi:RNA polymerase sigma-70 factor (ECF subfamily)